VDNSPVPHNLRLNVRDLPQPSLELPSSGAAALQLPQLSISVRELVAFSCAAGDLGGGSFSGPNRALEGSKGHQRVQKSRPPGYQTEVSLRHETNFGDLTLRILGRIDGVSRTVYGVRLEEIKTLAGAWSRNADPEHWAQLKIYGFIYAQQHGLSEVELQLTYLELQTNRLHELVELWRFESLRAFFERVTGAYVEWMRKELRWRACRDASLAELPFPHDTLRPGQQQLIDQVSNAINSGHKLFAEAPTGIGKTASVLFPALHALGGRKAEKIFYLTAKGSGKIIAEKSVSDFRSVGARVRSLTLTAREKICFGDQKPCDTSTCPFAKGYYDRSKAALKDLLEREFITRGVIEEVARKHTVCPFQLSLEAVDWSELIVCDYNYLFDPAAFLKHLFAAPGNDYLFLIDEAHNLLERAREMFSAEITSSELEGLRPFLQDVAPECAVGLRAAVKELEALSEEFLPEGRPECAIAESPRNLTTMLQGVVTSAEAWLSLNKKTEFREALTELYFKALAFVRTAEIFDDSHVTIVRRENGSILVRLFCVDPSRLLSAALQRGRTAIFFSATLSPLEYFRETLGGAPTDPLLSLTSPFPQEHMGLFINPRVRTDFRNRGRSYEEIALGIGHVALSRSGRYLAFFPSYDYLQQTLARFKILFPQLEVLVQRRSMSDAEREEFLDQFDLSLPNDTLQESSTPAAKLGFAVMGGVFGEGIDLVGDRLIGAIIVGVGLPQVCLERDLIKNYYDVQGKRGFAYAYIYPGMNKVLQAAGRVIRSEHDRGLALLVDARFAERPYRDLLPSWWAPKLVDTTTLPEVATTFWSAQR